MGDQIGLAISCFALGIILGFILRDSLVSFFEKNKDFKVARMEELPEGEYTVLGRKPKGNCQEVLIIQRCEKDREVGPIMAVFFTQDLINVSETEELGYISSFSLFHEKHSRFVKIVFTNSAEIVTLKKTLGRFVSREPWEKTSRVFN